MSDISDIFDIQVGALQASKVWQRIKGFFKKAVSIVGKVLPIVK